MPMPKSIRLIGTNIEHDGRKFTCVRVFKMHAVYLSHGSTTELLVPINSQTPREKQRQIIERPIARLRRQQGPSKRPQQLWNEQRPKPSQVDETDWASLCYASRLSKDELKSRAKMLGLSVQEVADELRMMRLEHIKDGIGLAVNQD